MWIILEGRRKAEKTRFLINSEKIKFIYSVDLKVIIECDDRKIEFEFLDEVDLKTTFGLLMGLKNNE